MSIQLPELNQAVLDWETVERLLDDVAKCGQLLEVIQKYSSKRMVASPAETAPATSTEPTLTLDNARDLLRRGEAHGIQLRYRFEGAVWWDTLLRHPEGYRLVRIRHE